MATANQGLQRIGWKFSTPLQADYLNTFIAGFSTPGLITRPFIDKKTSSGGAEIVIGPFSLLINPSDTVSDKTDADNNKLAQKMVKITTTNDISISISENTIALGFDYTFSDPGTASTQSQWYGEVKALSENNFSGEDAFKGIIIATCQKFENATGMKFYSVTTNGADISDLLLMKEGWNPNKWLSVISPRRAVTQGGPYYNKLEVRSHNDSYLGYMNGNSGLVELSNLTYSMETNPSINPDGTRGFMPKNYNAFKLQSAGFDIAECSDTLPIEKTSGGIFALVDASIVNAGNDKDSFTNNLKIKPVQQEDINIYYDDNTLFIR